MAALVRSLLNFEKPLRLKGACRVGGEDNLLKSDARAGI